MLSNLIKDVINHNMYEKEDMLRKLNLFLLVNQLKEDEYMELLAFLDKKEKEDMKEIKPIEEVSKKEDDSLVKK